jgi:hypothetical protein
VAKDTSSGSVPQASSSHEPPPAHPLEELPIWARRIAAGVLVPLTVGLFWVLSCRLDRVTLHRVTDLARTGSRDVASNIVQDWSRAHVLPRAAFAIGVDYLFIVLYLVTVSLLCLLGTRRRWLRWMGVVVAWLQIAAAGADIVENYSLLRLIRAPLVGQIGHTIQAAPIARNWFWTKAAILALGLLYFLVWLIFYFIEREGPAGKLTIVGASIVAGILIWRYDWAQSNVFLTVADRTRDQAPEPEHIAARGEPIDGLRRSLPPTALIAIVLLSALWMVGPNAGRRTVLGLVTSSATEASKLATAWSDLALVDVGIRIGLFYLVLVATIATLVMASLWMVNVKGWRRWAAAGASLQLITAGSGVVFAHAVRRIVFRGTPQEIQQLSRYAKAAFWIGLGAILAAFAIGAWSGIIWAWRAANGRSDANHPKTILPGEQTPWGRLQDWFLGRKGEPLVPERPMPEPDEGRLGICCSGGGIRSAAYNLGALQVLQERRPGQQSEFDRARYLAAVSGGSYIAAGHAIVRKESTEPLGDRPAFSPGSEEERYLRNRSSYLAPGAGGKWYAFWRMIRGLSVNLSLVTGVLFVAGWLFGLATRSVVFETDRTWDVTFRGTWFVVCIGVTVAAGAAAVILGAIEVISNWRDSVSRGLEAWIIRLINVAIVGLGLFVGMPYLLKYIANNNLVDLLSGVSFGGIGGILAGVGLYVGSVRAADKKQVNHKTKKAQGDSRTKRLWEKAGPKLRQLAIIALVSILGPAATVASFVLFARLGLGTTSPMMLVFFMVTVGWLWLLWGVGDLTSWSMHPFYRRRLASAFALRRVRVNEDSVAEEVTDHPIHFVPWDDTERNKLLPERPELVVCAAANVSDPGAVPPGRRVVSFTFSSTAIDGTLVGCLPTVEYQSAVGRRFRHETTIPAAVAMSGAAISPAMGKLTKRAYTFLLALTNVRLGVWLPSPHAIHRWKENHPNPDTAFPVPFRARPHYLLKELFGLTSIRDRFVYVTDGGHYENLGLVELLARGCTEIYCFDASGDAEDRYRTLGQAIAIARVDLGVEIDIHPTLMDVDKDHLAENVVVVGKYRFKGDPPQPDSSKWRGKLLYAKAGVPTNISWDVRAYQIADPVFPHHSTASQLYTDERFEAYRALGSAAARRAIQRMTSLRTEGPTRPDEPPPIVMDGALVSSIGPPSPEAGAG